MANVTESSNGNKSNLETIDPWFRIKLTTDSMRWDSLKISPCKEFEENILRHMNETSRKSFDSWIPVNVSIYDVDTCETYETTLCKKEAFWFEPMPMLGEKSKKGKCSSSSSSSSSNSSFKEIVKEPHCYDLEKARQEFYYSIEPFKQIIRKRGLKYDQEIGLRFSPGKLILGFQFRVLHSPFSVLF